MVKNHLNSVKDAQDSFAVFQKINPDPYNFNTEMDYIWNQLTPEYQAKIIEYAKVSKLICGGCRELTELQRENFAWGVNEGVTIFNIPDYVSY